MTLDDIRPLFPELPADKQLPHPIVVLDTETTGLPYQPRKRNPAKRGHPDSRAIEIGAVALARDGVPVSLFTCLIKPHRWPSDGLWPTLIEAGLTQEVIGARGYTSAEAHEMLCEWWPSVPALDPNGVRNPNIVSRPVPWVAFNAPFDRAILAQGEMLPPTFDEARPGCIMLAAMRAMDHDHALPRWGSGEAKWPTADEAMAFLQIDFPHPHRALPDAIGEALILTTLARKGWAPWR